MIDIKTLPVFCINLDRRPERWDIFSKQPGLKGVSVQRISAVDGQTLDIRTIQGVSDETRLRILKTTRRAHGEICTKGAIGCSLSHKKVWDVFIASNKPYCLVLEDDAMIPEGFLQELSHLTLPKQTDLWLLAPKLLEPAIPLDTLWMKPQQFWGTAAYLLTQSGAKLLQSHIFPIENHLDRFFTVQQMLGRLNLVVHKTLRTGVIGIGTDIQIGTCDLCNLPDSLSDSEYMLIKKHHLLLTGAVGVLLLYFFSLAKRNDS